MTAKQRRKNAGFTLTEMLAALAIVAVLLAVAIPNLISLQRDLRLSQQNDFARQIYVAAQYSLSLRRSDGTLQTLGGQPVSVKPLDFPDHEAPWPGVTGEYSYLTEQTAAALFPAGSIDPAVFDGYFIVEYNKHVGFVYGVFYSDEPFEYSGGALTRDRELRRITGIGYYGGDVAVFHQFARAPKAQLAIQNGEALILEIDREADLRYTVTLRGETSGREQSLSFTNATYPSVLGGAVTVEEDRYLLTLDALQSGRRFYEQFPTLFPGENLRISVATTHASGVATLGSVATISTNSLFAAYQVRPSEWDSSYSAGHVQIANPRHLQNLSASHARIDYTGQLGLLECYAVQTAPIHWSSGVFIPIGFNVNYDGRTLPISNLTIGPDPYSGSAGLFGSTMSVLLQNIRLVNCTISAARLAGDAGILVGTFETGEIDNCAVYVTDRTNLARYQVVGTKTAGGLVGDANGRDFGVFISNSFAAMPTVRTTGTVEYTAKYAGGLIGAAAWAEVSNCYASTGYSPDGRSFSGGVRIDSFNAFAGGFMGTASGSTLLNCYASGYVYAPERLGVSGEFIGDAMSAFIQNCYAAVYKQGGGSEPFGRPSGGSLYYLDFGQQYELPRAAALSAEQLSALSLGSPWYHLAPARSFQLPAQTYPYPALSGMTHFGDWASPLPVERAATAVLYYERYADNSFGYFGSLDGTAVDTRLPIPPEESGWVLLRNSGETALTLTYQLGEQLFTADLTAKSASLFGRSYQGFHLPVPEAGLILHFDGTPFAGEFPPLEAHEQIEPPPEAPALPDEHQP